MGFMGRPINPDGRRSYKTIHLPSHPRARSTGHVDEHVVVAEAKLGRYLLPSEVVHHKDEDRQNNDPENLHVFTSQAEHARYHKSLHPEQMVTLTCPACGKKFTVPRRQTHLVKKNQKNPTCCSRHCSGIYAVRIYRELKVKEIVTPT